MANAVVVKIEGLGQLLAACAKADTEVQTRAARALLASALRIETEAKQRCPVDTGRLRSSIRSDVDETKLEGQVWTNVKYAPFVEFGTSKQHAQPYMTPAAELERPKIIAALEQLINGLGI